MFEFGLDPIALRFGWLEIEWHGLFAAAAVGLGTWIGIRNAKLIGAPSQALSDVALWAIVGGLIGARALHVLDHSSYFLSNPMQMFAFWHGGMAAYGGFLGGIVGGVVSARRSGLTIWPLLDAVSPALLVGQMVGRLGCLTNGDAWGEPTGGNWGLVYQHPSAVLPSHLLNMPTHPYPVYEIVAVAVLLLCLRLGRRFISPVGATFLLTALGYAVIRFGLTFFRQETIIFGEIQEAQLVALVTGGIAIATLLWRRYRVDAEQQTIT